MLEALEVLPGRVEMAMLALALVRVVVVEAEAEAGVEEVVEVVEEEESLGQKVGVEAV